MSYFKYFLSFIYFLNAFISLYALESDLIESLPGLDPKPKFLQYSGYLNATEGRHLFYWFIESQKSPAEDPLILWLNGGPACSSLEGLFLENGPYRVSPDGTKLTYDEYSWNSLANVLYLESPAGVGFSYQDNNEYKSNDFDTLKFNFEALKQFFVKFPQFKNHKFYITGESYAGVYIPTLATKILSDKSSGINLKGIAIGNGMFDPVIFGSSRLRFAHYHGLIDTQTWNEATAECCSCRQSDQFCEFPIINSNYTITPINNNEKCTAQMKLIFQKFLASGIDPYNIYDFCPKFKSPNVLLNSYFRKTRFFSNMNIDLNELETNEIPENINTEYFEEVKQTHECVSHGYYEYLKKPEVLKALHISPKAKSWAESNTELLLSYVQNYPNMKQQFEDLVHKYKLDPIIIYNGDIDMVCDFIGAEIFLEGLKLPVVKNSTKWVHNGVTAGFIKRYNGLTYTTIRGAGHMAPTQKPGPCLRIIEELIGKSKML
jgi:cathepsin A (carboxypeptidase C)